MYRKRTKGSKKYNENRVKARLRAIEEVPAPDYPPDLNFKGKLRRRITIEDFDFGHVTEVIEMYGTDRIDCYEMRVDGKTVLKRAGFANILAKIRQAFPRVNSWAG